MGTAIRSLTQHKSIADSEGEMLFMFKTMHYGLLTAPCIEYAS